ncbi:MAG: peptidoglycan-binding protein [Bauldia sp.]|nr:peptidoglycan-binding protein [Bauldia sp.]
MLDRVARYPDFDYDEPDERRGFLGRFAGRALRNPGRTLAILLIVGGTGVIGANATFFQTGEHPSPLFSTRGADEGAASMAAVAAEEAEPVAAPRAAAPAEDELARLVETSTETPAAPVNRGPQVSQTVTEVQQLLTDLGYRPGTVDGLLGGQTGAAIEAFQRDRGMTVTGDIDASLLSALRQASASPGETVPVAPPPEVQLRAVQTALNEAGYGPIEVNGAADADTQDAIRRFQLDNGLGVSGAVDATLIDRMIAIGAMTR